MSLNVIGQLLFIVTLGVSTAVNGALSPYNTNLDNETVRSTCDSIRNRATCKESSPLSPSWCKFRNPFIIPRLPTSGAFFNISQNGTGLHSYKCTGDGWNSDCSLVHGIFPGGVSNHQLSLMYTANSKNKKGSSQVFMENNFGIISSNMESSYTLTSLAVLEDPDPLSQTVAFSGSLAGSNVPLLLDILHLQLPINSTAWKTNRIGQIVFPKPNDSSAYDTVEFGEGNGGGGTLDWLRRGDGTPVLMAHIVYSNSKNKATDKRHRFMFYPVKLNKTSPTIHVSEAWGFDVHTPKGDVTVSFDAKQAFVNCPAQQIKSSTPFASGHGCDAVTIMAFGLNEYIFLAEYKSLKKQLKVDSNTTECKSNCPGDNSNTFRFIGGNANAQCAGCGFSHAKTYSIEHSIVLKDETFAGTYMFYALHDGSKFDLVKLMVGGPPINYVDYGRTGATYNQKVWIIAEHSDNSKPSNKLTMIEVVETSLGYTDVVVVGNNCSQMQNTAQYYDKTKLTCKPRPQTTFYESASSHINDIHIAWRGISEEAKELADKTNCSTYNTNCIVSSSIGPNAPPDVRNQIQNNLQKYTVPENGKSIPSAMTGVTLENVVQLPHLEAQILVIYATATDKSMHIFQAYETLNQCQSAETEGAYSLIAPSDGNILYINQINIVAFVGKPLASYVTANSHYIFTALQRKKWELDSMVRRFKLCQLYNNDPKNVTLMAFGSKLECSATGPKQPRLPGIQDFLQITTLCLPGMMCPSLNTEELTTVEDGYYNEYGFEKNICKKGHFCKSGIHACPIGFTCNDEGMTVPNKCESTANGRFHCFETGLSRSIAAPNGTMVIAPYMPPFPASPGMKQKVSWTTTYEYFSNTSQTRMIKEEENVLVNCTLGEFCSIGSSLYKNTNCPAQTYCLNPSDYVPRVCRFPDLLCKCPNEIDHICDECPGVQFCDEGTVSPKPCKSGHVCKFTLGTPALGDVPKIEPPVQCPLTLYCPAGSYEFYACPSGYYCADPTVRKICPAGHFCPEGSTEPTQCKLFEVCEEGSTISVPIWPYVAIVCVTLAAYGISKLYTRVRNTRRDNREEHRHQIDLLVLNPARQSEVRRKISNTNDSGTNLDRLKAFGYIGDDEAKGKEEQRPDASTSSSSFAGALELSDMAPKFQIDFRFENLGLNIKGSGKSVLKGVTGEILHGRVTAVMGPSGAGKSTFMTTLAGKAYYGNQTGTVYINGVSETLSKYKRIVGFVPQEDIMMRDMTVKENLQYSGNIRLSSKLTQMERRIKIRKCIDLLDLREIRHSRIGDESTRGISGGQRKRVNIGLEMVADPSVLFLDEPTSGLDSTSSLEVCKALRDIAETGITVITVIHQPRYEIFTMFHDVLLLGKGGQTVYLGPSEDAIKYFESIGFFCPERTNPADFFMDVIAGGVMRKGDKAPFDPVKLFTLWENHQKKKAKSDTVRISTNGKQNKENVLVKRSQASCCKMFYLFMRRAITQQGRHPLNIAIDNAFVVLAAFFLGISFATSGWWKPPAATSNFIGCPTEVKGLLQKLTVGLNDKILIRGSMTLMAVSLAGSASAVRIFGQERVVYFRESAGITQPWGSIAYFFAKDVAAWPQILVGSFCFQLIFKAIASPLMNNSEVFLCLMPIYYCAYGVGMLVSIAVQPNLAQLCGFVFVFINQLYSGSLSPIPMMQKDIFPLNALYHLSFLRYANENFYTTEAIRHKAVSDSLGISMEDTIKENFGFSFDTFYTNLGYIFLWGFGIRIVACILMMLKDRTKKL